VIPSSPIPPAAAGSAAPAADIDFHRYRKLRRFVALTFLEAFLHDVLLARPFLRWARRPPLARWTEVARRYRALAGEMGGVLIKLGQFLSIRVDILPPEVTRELAGLQDEVPPGPFAAIAREVAADLGRPLAEVFASFEERPMGSASLAQVHAARLLPAPREAGGGRDESDDAAPRDVVVKVLRPGIDRIVETDLAAIRLAVRLLKPWKRIRRRVDLDRLAEEVTVTTRAELDLVAEGRNAERFAADFAGDPVVRVPRVYWSTSGRRTLTLENVAFLKIGDRAALDAAGISRPELAKALYRTYMRQLFVHDFVHADPHPGNLFVRPLPGGDGVSGTAAAGAGEAAPVGGAAVAAPGRPFELVFVDFGMVAVIPQRLRAALREVLLGLGTRDAERIVHAAQSAGLLLPGADLRRLIEVHEDLFQRFWGVRIGDVRQVALSEARYFLREYRDLLFELPFQVQVDLLYVSRALGLVAGLTTSLDPQFDPWAETMPFAEQLRREEMAPTATAWLRLLGEQAVVATRLPEKADRVLTRADRGTLEMKVTLATDRWRPLERVERMTRRLGWSVLAAALLVSGSLLRAGEPADPLAPWLWGAAVAAFLWGILRGR
jgi:predicted unusual protein kinase regulating ubiquinone biosynthesis (AarF/ABC1/UbiB family)